MSENTKLHDKIKTILESSENRKTKAERIAEAVRSSGNHRWVGIYDVSETEIAAIAWSGLGEPAFPRFPITKGLSGEAVASRSTIVSNDVESDSRYLTAFGNTQSEIIVPVISSQTGAVVGTIDVESERKNAFADADQKFLEECAGAILGLWE